MAASHARDHAAPDGVDGSMAPVRVWLLAVAALVLAMVVVGGTTRLTGSGLSITEWKPIMGAIPPLSDADWHDVFEKYKQTPEYRIVNQGMTLADFKSIFWWEWGHRQLGRFIGFAFAVPFGWFLMRGRLPRPLAWRLAGLLALGGLQGGIGWFMVQSGLVERTDVSQYRLALHLMIAVAILAGLVWVALDLGRPRREEAPADGRVRTGASIVLGLVLLQVFLGALVAGLKAGLAHNTWPLMDGRLIPTGLNVMSPWHLNFFENALTVQFNHRMVAYVLAIAAWLQWRAAARAEAAPAGVWKSAGVLLVLVLAQAGLGIWTLLAHVPLSLGLLHQAGAMAVLIAAVVHAHRARGTAAEEV